MKFIIPFLMSLLTVASVYAGPDQQPIVLENVCSNVTIVARTDAEISGYIESIYIDLPLSAYTSTVTFATSNQTVFIANPGSDQMYYPRILACNTGGVATSAEYVRPFLYGEKLQATITTIATSLVTRTVNVLVKTNDK